MLSRAGSPGCVGTLGYSRLYARLLYAWGQLQWIDLV